MAIVHKSSEKVTKKIATFCGGAASSKRGATPLPLGLTHTGRQDVTWVSALIFRAEKRDGVTKKVQLSTGLVTPGACAGKC